MRTETLQNYVIIEESVLDSGKNVERSGQFTTPQGLISRNLQICYDRSMEQMNAQVRAIEMASESSRFMSRVYFWMTVGIALTGLVAWFIGSSEELTMTIVRTPGIFILCLVAQFGIAFGMGLAMRKSSPAVVTSLYLTFALSMGVTFSTLFLAYAHESLIQVFGVTAFAFAGLGVVGYVTKKDLSAVGSFCIMGLWGLIALSLMRVFGFGSESTMEPLMGLMGLIVFSGLTAYDTQKIKQLGMSGVMGETRGGAQNFAIYGAFTLYLDFINLFISLLRLMGRRR